MSTIGKPDMNRPAIDRRFAGIDRYTFLSGQETTQQTTQETAQEKILAQLRISPHLTRRRNIESWGRGIERINRKCLAHGIDAPINDYSLSGLMLTFRASPQRLLDALGYQGARRILGEKVGGATTPITTRNQLVSLILANPDISHKELAKTLGLTRDGIKYHLNKMKRNGVIRHVGPSRGGHWEVLK